MLPPGSTIHINTVPPAKRTLPYNHISPIPRYHQVLTPNSGTEDSSTAHRNS